MKKKLALLSALVSKNRVLLLWLVGWTFYFSRFWLGAFFLDTHGNFMTTHINLWGDWAAHFTMGSRFGYRSLLPDESPFLAGASFSYPFVSNWLSGVLIRLGIPFFTSFVVPSWFFSISMVAALYYWFQTWLGSTKRALTASLLMLCTGGFGFMWVLKYQVAHATSLATWLHMPFQATNVPEQGIRWLSMVDSMIIPQRAFTLGFTVSLICLGLTYQWLVKGVPHNKWQAMGLGLVLGSLVLIHTHSFLAVGSILVSWFGIFLWQKKPKLSDLVQTCRPWLKVGVPAFVVAAPLYVAFFAHQVGGFIHWAPGWLAPEFGLSWIDFWLRNWGPTLILGALGLVISRKWAAAVWGWPFLVWFILPNLWLFQPWNWDNTKLLIWSAVGITGFATLALSWLWRSHAQWVKISAVACFVLAILSGALDLYWIQRRDLHTYQMYSAEELQAAEWVKLHTSSEGRWLTGAEHNHWLFNLTGRQTLMAYRGWLWTQGYAYGDREKMVREQFYKPDLTMLHELGVQYVVLGREEQDVWGAEPLHFASIGQEIYRSATISIYQLLSPI